MAAADVELIPKVCIKFNAKYHLTGTFHSHTHSHTNTNTKKNKKRIKKNTRIVLRNSNEIYSFRELFLNVQNLSILP